MAGTLEGAGYACADDISDADVIVYNTCSIRDKAEQKVYSALGKQVRAHFSGRGAAADLLHRGPQHRSACGKLTSWQRRPDCQTLTPFCSASMCTCLLFIMKSFPQAVTRLLHVRCQDSKALL